MFRTAHELCQAREVPLSAAAVARLDWNASPPAYVRVLLAENLLADARHLLAQALPTREALAWGCCCIRQAFCLSSAQEAAVAAVERYVAEPTDAHRRATEVRATEVGLDSAAGCLAVAAFCSDGSLLPSALPVMAPPAFVTGRLVSVAVYLAAVHRDPAHYQDQLRGYLHDALARLEEASAPGRTRVGDVA
jgi:hypothetical protein